MDRRVQNQEPEQTLLSWVIPAMFVVEVRKVSNGQQNQDKVHKTEVWENTGGWSQGQSSQLYPTLTGVFFLAAQMPASGSSVQSITPSGQVQGIVSSPRLVETHFLVKLLSILNFQNYCMYMPSPQSNGNCWIVSVKLGSLNPVEWWESW